MMNAQTFAVILSGKDTLNEKTVEQLYARCEDASAGSCEGVGHVRFDRPGNSFNEAIASAVADLRAGGLEVERIEIEMEDLKKVVQAPA